MPQTSVGVVSDTHGLLREEVLERLAGSDLIIHAGDVGDPEILVRLRALAPVVAVKGNIDRRKPLSELPSTELVEARGCHIYVLHDLEELDLDPRAAQIDIVISGHSHKPSLHEKHGVLYLNPGSAGPRRFRLPVSIARVDVTQKPVRVEFVDLYVKQEERAHRADS
jgi:putative phosphoesterase